MAVNFSDAQFRQLLEANARAVASAMSNSQRKGSFANCSETYDGRKDSEVLETFLAAVGVYKRIENISDAEAIEGLPLLLKGDAAMWWQGIKSNVSTWEDFLKRVRNNYAPKKEAFMVYQEIMGSKQSMESTTDNFITMKRMLFTHLPASHTLPEEQQLDMVFGLLHVNIRSQIPRNSVKTFDDLLERARTVEQIMTEKKECLRGQGFNEASKSRSLTGTRTRCGFCRVAGHVADVCRKKKRAEQQQIPVQVAKRLSESTQAPSPTTPMFSCYGCGAPGVVRTSCPTCLNKTRHPIKPEDVGYCAVDVRADTRSRPVVFVSVDSELNVPAYVDTCAKTSVASYDLFCSLRDKGHTFGRTEATVTLADGVQKVQEILTLEATVKLGNKQVPTKFVVLPDSRDNRTLLGIGFIEDARMLLNLPQFTWHFIEEPHLEYELLEEEYVSFKPKYQNNRQLLTTPPVKPVTPNVSVGSITPVLSMEASTPGTPLSPCTPERQLSATDETCPEYKLIPMYSDSPPREKKARTLFDGYSPRFVDYMMRDAQINVYSQEVTLSPHSRQLFPDNEHIHIDSINVEFKDSIMSLEQREELKQFLSSNEDVFKSNGYPSTQAEHCIDTQGHHPISVPPYRLSNVRKELLRTEIDNMLKEGVIEACASPWAAPVVLVPKPDGGTRVCIDYRRLNAITVSDAYPIPRIDDLLHEAKPTPFMSTLDLKSGYWQIKVRKEDQEKTAFITPFGIFQFKRMPFGLKNAPATFQRLIDRFKVSLENLKMLAYLDDLVIFSTSFEHHLSDLKDVFQRMREYNLTVNGKKCRFCCSSIKYLGHFITPEGLKVDPDKTAAISNLPTPTNLRHLVSFLQTCSWYRRFIENFSAIAEPLTKLSKKNVQWEWTEKQDTAYKELKHRLTSTPVLRQADTSKPYIIKTDASNYALGAVLVQGEGQEEHPVEYASRLLKPAEKNYTTTEREALAVVWAISKFRGYIEGLPITVITDHQALKWLMNLKSPSGRLARWALQLQVHDITIKYAPGRTNVVADALSRPPCTENMVKDCGICSFTVDIPVRSPAEIRKEQLSDQSIQRIINALEEATKTEDAVYWSNKGYIMNNGLLYRYSHDSDFDDAQIVVPEHEWANILAAYHDDPRAGHYGVDKTYKRITKRYFWKGMRKYIESYIRNCLPCQRYKPNNMKPAGLLQTTAINKRFEIVSFDLFGPLPPSIDEKTWIFIVEDVATRWVELFALEVATAENCGKILLNEIFLRYGIPRRLISDNGPQFVSAVMQQITCCLNIKQGYTPVYHPEANPVERRNRDLKTQLAILVEENHRNWPEQLPSIRFAMNSAVCASTEHSPAFLTFGRELRTADDATHDLREIVQSENFVPEITPKLLQIADTLKRVKEAQEGKEETRKQYVDQYRRSSPVYAPGDLVLTTLHPISKAAQGVSAKFMPRRDGPYIIVQQHGPTSYQIALPATPDTVIGTYHSSMLVPYHGKTASVPDPVKPLRKRGRPKKTATKVDAIIPTRKGRGRPKKPMTPVTPAEKERG